jgi:hypothetical protein
MLTWFTPGKVIAPVSAGNKTTPVFRGCLQGVSDTDLSFELTG